MPFAVLNLEICHTNWRDSFHGDVVDTRGRRRPLPQFRHKRVDHRGGSLDCNLNTARGVHHRTGEAVPLGEVEHEWPKAHALHNSPNPQATAL
jgi:hypothetical protein